MLESATVDDISTNLVWLVEMPADRTWDQFFFFVKPFGEAKRSLVEGDFLETIASVKSRLLMDRPADERPPDSQIGLIHKWTVLDDGMGLDDETVDIPVGFTLDLFIREPEQCKLIIKSTCYKSFTIVADLSESVAQLMERIEAQEQ